MPPIGLVCETEHWIDLQPVFLQLQIPAPLFVPAKPDAAVGDMEITTGRVNHHGFPLGVICLRTQVCGAQEPAGRMGVATLVEHHHEGQVGILLGVVNKIGHLAVEVELLDDDVGHGHGQGRVRPRPGRQPGIGELDILGVIGCHGCHPGATVARLGVKMGIGGTRHWQVGAPDDKIA